MPPAQLFFESVANVMIRTSSPGGAEEPYIDSATGISAPQTFMLRKTWRLDGVIMAR
jgi:hypothetical protein